MPTQSEPRLPRHYGEVRHEYDRAISAAVVRDCSHLGRLRFDGADHLDFLHRMSTNDFNSLTSGTGLQAVFTDNRGRILELGTFFRDGDSSLAIVSPGGGQRLLEWLERFHFAERFEMVDVASATAMIEVFGPDASTVAREIAGNPLPDDNLRVLREAGDTGIWFARVDRFGHAGFLVVGPPGSVRDSWSQLLRAGATPIGEEAWDILRVEAGLPIHDAELNEDHNPWEAGLDDAIHLDKGCYIGQEVLARLDTYDKVKQHLVGLGLPPDLSPVASAPLRAGRKEAGTVTSTCCSPRFGNIGLAYVRTAHAAEGTVLSCESEGSEQTATVVALPFR